MSETNSTPATPAANRADAAMERLREAQSGQRRQAFFTSDLSVDELILMEDAKFTPLHLVFGSSIYHVGYQFAGLGSSQELDVLSNALHQARSYAMQRMLGEAQAVGADGVIGVRLEVGRAEWGPHMLEFIAFGTAIKSLGTETTFRNNKNLPFSSHLSGQDFYALIHAGYRPLEMVMGNCVYHVAYQGLGSWFGNIGKNVEMVNFTEAIYQARELAMGRMQTEAEQHGAEGIVGVEISEKSHSWGGHTIEFFALGTAVQPIRADHLIPTPAMALSLDR